MVDDERSGPDLRPWDPETAQRVQPVLSALFHDIMSPLTLMKNRLFLIRRHLATTLNDPTLSADSRQRIAAILHLLDALEDATSRIHKGMTVPRDAIWEALLEGVPFDPADVIERVGASMKLGDPAGAGTEGGADAGPSAPRETRHA